MKKLCTLVLTLAAAATAFYLVPTKTSAKSEKLHRSQRPVPDQYIVVLEETALGFSNSIENSSAALSQDYHGEVREVYSNGLNAYSVNMSEKSAIQLSEDPRVKYVEEDGEVEVQSTESNAPWGISRVDQRNWAYPLDSNYEYSATGQGVNVYVLDTRVQVSHPDFEGRAVAAYDAFNDNTPVENCNLHGTHVAGTIASHTYGVAKSAAVYSVAVIPCTGTGTSSSVLSGLNWVAANAIRPAVINMSFVSSPSSSIESAVQSLINSGVTSVSAAGNQNDDACNYSPGRMSDIINVGSTDNRDYRSDISNFGRCVDVFAPGVDILSTSNKITDYWAALSGTSTASPHVAGVAALYLERNPSALPRQVSDAIVGNGTSGILSQVGTGSPNVFLYSMFFSTGGGSTPSCSGTLYAGSLSMPGTMDYQSSSSGFNGGNGVYKASIDVPAGAAFTLTLQKQSKRTWSEVVSTNGSQPINYRGKSGVYRWRVTDVAGSGSYAMCTATP
jgi:subtilisin family serine protease